MKRRALVVVVVVVAAMAGWGGGKPRHAEAVTTWQYTALGDSLAFGLWAFQGYVPRYERLVETDTGAAVNPLNLGVPGWTSTDLLGAVRTNLAMRAAVATSRVVTWDIGGNDFLDARGQYRSGGCGGADNQDCLRSGIATFKVNWTAILGQLTSLRAGRPTIFRTMDIYNPYVNEDRARDSWANDGGRTDFQVFKPYLDEANAHITATATARGIPVAKVFLAFNGPAGDHDPSDKGYLAFDGLHPNDLGHRVIADRFRALGYSPLR